MCMNNIAYYPAITTLGYAPVPNFCYTGDTVYLYDNFTFPSEW